MEGITLRSRIDTVVALGLALASGAAALTALMACIAGIVQPGVTVEGATVDEVFPGTVAWRAGVRAGQQVVAVSAADEAGGWALITSVDGQELVATTGPSEELLRRLVPVALLSLAHAAAAALWAQRRPRRAQAVGILALGYAVLPLSVESDPIASTLVPVLATLTPAAWLARWTPRRHAALAFFIVALLIVGLWVSTRAAGVELYAVAEVATLGTLVLGLATVVGTLVLKSWEHAARAADDRRWVIDAAGVILVGLVVAGLVVVGAPWLVTAGMLAGLLVIFPVARRAAIAVVDRLVLSEARNRASVEASEAERARLARDLHDAPLQQLAGVIKLLELVPGAAREGDMLRDVAEELRSMASGLYPVLLEDLGVAAAIEQLAQGGAEHPEVDIVVELDDRTGRDAEHRPPAQVELAVYRITHEAVTNAVRHSRGRLIVVTGSVARDAVLITVTDDGAGFEPHAARKALESGHLGLASMRSRAAAIGAELDITSGAHGSEVSLRWAA